GLAQLGERRKSKTRPQTWLYCNPKAKGYAGHWFDSNTPHLTPLILAGFLFYLCSVTDNTQPSEGGDLGSIPGGDTSGAKMKPTKKEAAAIETLRSALDTLPDSVWLYVADGCIHVMRNNKNGDRAVSDNGGMNQDYILASLPCDIDGGDW